ncbi:MAG: metallopeptidase family protein [Actinopolymorphaceae bacterium]
MFGPQDDAGPPEGSPGYPLPPAETRVSRPGHGAGLPERTTGRRDRHGRGMRGPLAIRGPLAPSGVPVTRSRAERFDELVLDAVEALERRFAKELDGVEFAVEEVPDPHRATTDDVPLGSAHASTTGQPHRVVVYRRPIELRAAGPADLSSLVHDVVVEQVAELLGLSPDEIDPAYGED